MEADDLQGFLLRACHDLRAPLRNVRMNAELLARFPEKREGAELERILGFMLDGARRADAVVDGLAAYSLALGTQAESGGLVRMDAVVRAALAKLAKAG